MPDAGSGLPPEVDRTRRPTASQARSQAIADAVSAGIPGWAPEKTPGLLRLAAQADSEFAVPAMLAWLHLAACDMPRANAALHQWRTALSACPPPVRQGLPRLLRRRDVLVAEILQEARLAPGAAEAARSAIARGDGEAAAALVRSVPGSYPAAVAAVTLAEAEHRSHSADDSRSIPRVIVQGWFDTAMPDEVRDLTKTWARHHPGWDHRVFDTLSAAAWIRDHMGLDAERIFRSASPVGKSNLFRYAYLSILGGLWSDADDRCLTSVAPLIRGRSLVVVRESLGAVADNFMAAAPRHPVLAATRDEAFSNVQDGFEESPWLANGPGVVTRKTAAWLTGQLGGEVSDYLIAPGPRMAEYVEMHVQLDYKESTMAWDVPADPSAELPIHLQRPWDTPHPLSRRQRRLMDLIS